MNYDHYNHNSPNFYKKSYYTSTYCRNYKKPKILFGIFDDPNAKSLMNLDDEVRNKLSFKSLYNSSLFSPSKKSQIKSSSLYTSGCFTKNSDFDEMFYKSNYTKSSLYGRNSTIINKK